MYCIRLTIGVFAKKSCVMQNKILQYMSKTIIPNL